MQTQGANGIAAPDPARVQRGAPVTHRLLRRRRADRRQRPHLGPRRARRTRAPASAAASAPTSRSAAATCASASVDATGGSSVDAAGGTSGQITLAARGALHALGRLDAGGQNSTASQATPGRAHQRRAPAARSSSPAARGPAAARAPPAACRAARSSCRAAPSRPARSSPRARTRRTPGTPGNGGAGGAITVSAARNASIGSLQAYGGNAPAGTAPGPRRPDLASTSTGGSIATGRITTQGGYPNGGPGADGGPVALSAQTDLTVSDSLNTSGSSANGDATRRGRAATPATCCCAPRPARSRSATPCAPTAAAAAAHPVNGAFGGAGGAAGASTSSRARSGRSSRSPRTAATAATTATTAGPAAPAAPSSPGPTPRCSTIRRSSTPTAATATRSARRAPRRRSCRRSARRSTPAPALLSFTPRSPDAQRLPGPAQRRRRRRPSRRSRRRRAWASRSPAPVCVPVALSVVATNAQVGWTSDPSPRRRVHAARVGDAAVRRRAGADGREAAALQPRARCGGRSGARPSLLRANGIGTVKGTLTRAPRRGRKTSTRALAKLTREDRPARHPEAALDAPAGRPAARDATRCSSSPPPPTARAAGRPRSSWRSEDESHPLRGARRARSARARARRPRGAVRARRRLPGRPGPRRCPKLRKQVGARVTAISTYMTAGRPLSPSAHQGGQPQPRRCSSSPGSRTPGATAPSSRSTGSRRPPRARTTARCARSSGSCAACARARCCGRCRR